METFRNCQAKSIWQLINRSIIVSMIPTLLIRLKYSIGAILKDDHMAQRHVGLCGKSEILALHARDLQASFKE